jgi:hypothetical protein
MLVSHGRSLSELVKLKFPPLSSPSQNTAFAPSCGPDRPNVNSISKLTSRQHRGLFLTYHPDHALTHHRFSGTLFHASYIKVSPESNDSHWTLETRGVKDVTSSASLVLLIRLGTLDTGSKSIEEQFQRVSKILAEVPLGRANRESVLGKMKEGEGNPVLDGYDCIVWSKDALTALTNEGLIDLGGKHAGMLLHPSMISCRHFFFFFPFGCSLPSYKFIEINGPTNTNSSQTISWPLPVLWPVLQMRSLWSVSTSVDSRLLTYIPDHLTTSLSPKLIHTVILSI